MKKAQAGSVESNDILIVVSESDSLEINITSIVSAFFYDQIYQVITSTLQELNIDKIKVEAVDKGALDYTIKARLITAIERMGK
jgi:citrate lyase subunit gamma (acyl carrier protein)